MSKNKNKETQEQNNNEVTNNSETTQNTNADDIIKLTEEIEKQRNNYLMLMAEFQNFKKRIEGEKAMFGAIANLGIIQDILEIFDDISLALTDENLDLERSKSSLKIAQDKLLGAIGHVGVERIDIKVGDEFDKEKMEAITTIPVEDQNEKNKVVSIVSSAFKYKDKDGVIKHAKVIVGK